MNLEVDIETLKQATILSGMPEKELHWLISKGECQIIEPGEVLMAEGSQPDAFYIVLEGEFDILKNKEDQEILINTESSGKILGEMSLIEEMPRTATVRAKVQSQVLKIRSDVFTSLVEGNPSIAMKLLRTVMTRLSHNQAILQQQEKLASLGTLAAGLAHELNNPGSAARRSANQMRTMILAWMQTRNDIDILQLEPEYNNLILTRLLEDITKGKQQVSTLDPLMQSDLEYEIEDWLTEVGLEDAWEFAPFLISFGWDKQKLSNWADNFESNHIPIVLRWLATGYGVFNLMDEIDISTQRISEIVTAVKQYTFLDEAPLKTVDVHQGLETTLTILKHKLKQGVTVHRDYEADLPYIDAYGGELNQVWTNLIDNAIDAMNGSGILTLRTRLENKHILVTIEDNGPGIPKEVIPKLFDLFFTTKPVGSGTGLGLYVSHNIIKKHKGTIEVRSEPGKTEFLVLLPVQISSTH